jgi:hypothetical protein
MAAPTFAPYSEAVRRASGSFGVRGRASHIRLQRQDGQAMVEFILILPIFLIIAFAVIEFGKGLNYWIDLTHLANEGARYASVNRWPDCPVDDTSECPQTLKDYLAERAVSEELRSGGPNATAMEIDICLPEGASPEIGEAVRVTISTNYTVSVVDRLFDFLSLDGVGEVDLASSATMRLERLPTDERVLAEVSGSC